MEHILEKFGIYDLVAVWLTGIYILYFTIQIAFFFDITLLCDLVTVLLEGNIWFGEVLPYQSVVQFLAISYFIGVIFQEIGSFIQRIFIDRNKNLLFQVLGRLEENEEISKDNDVVLKEDDAEWVESKNREKNDRLSLTKKEKMQIVVLVQRELNMEDKPDEEMIYNYCRYYLINNSGTKRMDKEQTLASMSRSLSLYFALLFLFFGGVLIFGRRYECILWIVGTGIISLILFVRNIRFVKMRYLQVVRAAYYTYVIKERKKRK